MRALDAVWLLPRLGPAQHAVHAALSGGYGVTSPIAGGVQQRGTGSLAAGLGTRIGLALELRVDGRWDRHQAPGRDHSLSGSPRAYLRYGRALDTRLSLGFELGVWVPGRSAPSLAWHASSIDLLALGEVRLAHQFALLWGVGPRFDRSAQSVSFPAGQSFSPSDMASLGVSSYHALLSRVAIEQRHGARRIGVELSADTLLGRDAPPLRSSPLRAALVTSFPLGRHVALFAALGALLSKRAQLSQPGDYRPFEPRLFALLGVRLSFARQQPVAPHTPRAVTPAVRTLTIVALDELGAPLPDASVTLDARTMHTDGAGHAVFEVREGTQRLTLRAVGFADHDEVLRVQGSLVQRTVLLTPRATDGVLQVSVRDLVSGSPLPAQLTLRRLGPRRATGAVPHAIETAEQGHWQNDLGPGVYTLGVRAPGHVPQTHTFEVQAGGVVQVNVDLAAEPP